MEDSIRRRGDGAADEVHQLSSHSRSNEARRHFSSSKLVLFFFTILKDFVIFNHFVEV